MGKSSVSKQARAGITFPPSRIYNKFKSGKTWKQVESTAPVYTAAAAEHVIVSIFRHAAANVVAQKKSEKKGGPVSPTARINLIDIVTALREDVDASRLFAGFAFTSGQNTPKAFKLVTPASKKKAKKARSAVEEPEEPQDEAEADEEE